MNLSSTRASRLVVLGLLFSLQFNAALAQKSKGPDLATLERNLRAEMNFLASDALQGRGSGSNYERIAAEFIAAQFRQFGLEPAGDPDASGAPGFVQRVPMQSMKFTEAPALRVVGRTEARTWQFGRDLLVSNMRGA